MYNVYTALITPFNDDYSINYVVLEYILDKSIESGITGFVVNGTTGEASTLTLEEKRSLVEFVIKFVDGRSDIIVGVSSNNSLGVVNEINNVEDLDFNTYMICPPYYNNTTQAGLICHYEFIMEHTSKEILLYNVPSRCNMAFSVDTVAKLASYPQIIGIKEASGDMNYMLDIINNTDDEFKVYNGNDNLIIPTSSMKISGVISAISNTLINEISHLCNLISNDEADDALNYYLSIHNLINECYKNVNPIGVKALFEIMHKKDTSLRLPLVKADAWLYESLTKEVDKL